MSAISQLALPRSGATLLLELLQGEGVEYIFGNPGTTELPLMDALTDWSGIDYILGLQEASVVAMADGYAQASGKTAFLNLHTAGGLGHGMGNLLNASLSQTPLVVSVGQQDTRHRTSDPLLAGDIVGLADSAVKWSEEVTAADQLPVLVRRAFHDASSAPGGPVLLSLPMDVMEEQVCTPLPPRSVVDQRPVASSLDILARQLAEIPPQRLAIIAGDELFSSKASDDAVSVAELLGAPVFGSSWPSRIPFPTSHPLWRGNLPTRATEIASTLAEFDGLLALGGKSLITILYSEGSAVPSNCRIFQVSADVRALGRTFPTAFSAQGDLHQSLVELKRVLPQYLGQSQGLRKVALGQAAGRRSAERDRLSALATELENREPIAPLVAAREVVRAVGPHIPIVDEAIATSSHMRRWLNSDSSAQYSFLRGGALGWGMPAAVGCSLGIGREPVLCVVGDGAAMYSPQALWTAARESLPVTFVVMNNREYNVLKRFMQQQAHYVSHRRARFIAMDLNNPAIDYLSLARAMGVAAQRITQSSDIGAAVSAGLASGQPNLIEVVIGTD